MSTDFSKGLIAGAAAALTAAAAWYFSLHPKKPSSQKKVFVLAVRLTLNPEKGGLQAFLAAWQPLAKFCLENEPNTLSYELAYGEEDPNEIIIYERYVTKSDLVDVHHKGAAFLAFGKRIGPDGPLAGLVLNKTKATYFESNVGYMGRE